MIGLGLSIVRLVMRKHASGTVFVPPAVALKADLSDANANLAWVFW